MIKRYFHDVVIAFESILANKLKSMLTALGIIFGVAAVISMLAIGKGAQQEILEQIQMVGVNNILISLIIQETKRLTLEEVITIAQEQSPEAILAKHRFRASYWQFRTFKAEYLPSLTLSGTLPDYNRIFEKEYDFSTGQESYVEKQTNNSSLSMSLSQNIGLTGGNIYVQSDIRRFDVLGDNGSIQYVSTPVSIGFTQPLFRFNELKWQKQIEPLRYE